MLHRGKRAALAATMTGALALTACGGPSLPDSVVTGSQVTVGWSGPLTSTNAASLTGLTAGNADVAALTRRHFVDVVKGAAQPDTAFGAVSVVSDKPFTVRYDLAEPTWSDGVPVDAADLLLSWSAGADDRAGFQVMPGSLAGSTDLPAIDEFGRAIEVSYNAPVLDWQTALDVAVPAHVVGQIAFGKDDPMEAKQAVVRAILEGDDKTRAKVAAVWNAGFALKDGKAPDPRLLVSSGPYRVDAVTQRKGGAQRVELVANGEYAGAVMPRVERIVLDQMPDAAKVEAVGTTADVVQVAPTKENAATFHELERRDFQVTPSHDGTMWVLVLRADQPVFAAPAARAAFLRAVPRGDLTDAAGEWGSAYESSDALLVPPGGDGYEIATEDSHLGEKLTGGDGAAERAAAGVPAGAVVCVGYDAAQPFAAGAVAALRAGMAEAGWAVTDCGRPGFSAASPAGVQAMLVRVPVPTSALELSILWGGAPALNLGGVTNPIRDELIARLAGTAPSSKRSAADTVYAVRERRAAVEASLVDDAVALPIAMNPLITVAAPTVQGVTPRAGGVASLLGGATEWSSGAS